MAGAPAPSRYETAMPLAGHVPRTATVMNESECVGVEAVGTRGVGDFKGDGANGGHGGLRIVRVIVSMATTHRIRPGGVVAR